MIAYLGGPCAFFAVLVCCLAIATAARPATIEAGPQDAPGIRAVGSLNAADLGPGTIIRLHAGHYGAPIIVPLKGTKGAPITIEGASDGPISIEGSIVLDGAAFVIVRNLHIAHASDAGIILREGSHDNTISHNQIADTKLGIWIGQNAGNANRIEGNMVSNSATHGIAVDGVRGDPGRETWIAHNSVHDSGVHGIEVSGNYTIIEGNIINRSGRLSTGASGIHIFARSDDDKIGRHNIIRDNISASNQDPSAQDGNGIQVDQWCDDNLVIHNNVVGNDGAGISVFDAARTTIMGNTLLRNMLDPGHSHRHKGELTFASDDEHSVDNTRDAIAQSNTIVEENPAVAPILVDVPTSLHPPSFGSNHIRNIGKGPIARWAGRNIDTMAAWNALAPHSAPDDSNRPAPATGNSGQIKQRTRTYNLTNMSGPPEPEP